MKMDEVGTGHKRREEDRDCWVVDDDGLVSTDELVASDLARAKVKFLELRIPLRSAPARAPDLCAVCSKAEENSRLPLVRLTGAAGFTDVGGLESVDSDAELTLGRRDVLTDCA